MNDSSGDRGMRTPDPALTSPTFAYLDVYGKGQCFGVWPPGAWEARSPDREFALVAEMDRPGWVLTMEPIQEARLPYDREAR